VPASTSATTYRRLVDIDTAAAHLGVNPRTIRNYASTGLLTAYRVAGQRLLRFDIAEVDALAQPVPTVDRRVVA
jgi:excisionase family DNA binding protein